MRAAAAAGARVDDELLAAVLQPPDELAAALRVAVAHHLLAADPRDGRLAFRHELVREAAYAELLPGERRRLHAACARVLAERPELAESPASAAAAVARHWDAAGDARKRAGARACEPPAPPPACTRRRRHSCCTERALELWDAVADAERVAGMARLDALERTAETAVHAGERGGRASACSTRRSRSPIPPPSRCAPACCTRSAPGTRGPPGPPDPPCTSITPAALALIPADPPSEARARAVTDLAYTGMLDGIWATRTSGPSRRWRSPAAPVRARSRASRSTCSASPAGCVASTTRRSSACARRSRSRARPAAPRRSAAPT